MKGIIYAVIGIAIVLVVLYFMGVGDLKQKFNFGTPDTQNGKKTMPTAEELALKGYDDSEIAAIMASKGYIDGTLTSW